MLGETELFSLKDILSTWNNDNIIYFYIFA